MNIKDLELEAAKLEAFKVGYASCLNRMAEILRMEETTNKTMDSAQTVVCEQPK